MKRSGFCCLHSSFSYKTH